MSDRVWVEYYQEQRVSSEERGKEEDEEYAEYKGVLILLAYCLSVCIITAQNVEHSLSYVRLKTLILLLVSTQHVRRALTAQSRRCNHMTCSRCRHEFCWLCLSPYRGILHDCPGAPDVASFSQEQQHLIQQVVEKYDDSSERGETRIQRHAQELVEYAKAAVVCSSEDGVPAAGEAQQQRQQTEEAAIELPDVLEQNLEMGVLAAEIATANMASHTEFMAASMTPQAQGQQGQQPIGGTRPAMLNAVLELEAIYHCHAIDSSRSLEQRRVAYTARRMEEMPVWRRWRRRMGWERDQMEDDEVEGWQREGVENEQMEEEAQWALLHQQAASEEQNNIRLRAAEEGRRVRATLHGHERVAMQRRVASRYLASTQVRPSGEEDWRPSCALCSCSKCCT